MMGWVKYLLYIFLDCELRVTELLSVWPITKIVNNTMNQSERLASTCNTTSSPGTLLPGETLGTHVTGVKHVRDDYQDWFWFYSSNWLRIGERSIGIILLACVAGGFVGERENFAEFVLARAPQQNHQLRRLKCF